MTTRNRTIVRTARRARQWAIMPQTSGSIIGVTEAQKIAFDLQANLEIDLGYNLNNVTASAIRLDLTFDFQNTAVVGDRARCAWGIGWIQDDALAIGGTSLPNPSNDSFDWMAHGVFSVIADVAAVNSRPRNGLQMIRNDSQRKQRENHSSLVLIVAGILIDDPISVIVGGRVLFILP